jgi:hypothetical protein
MGLPLLLGGLASTVSDGRGCSLSLYDLLFETRMIDVKIGQDGRRGWISVRYYMLRFVDSVEAWGARNTVACDIHLPPPRLKSQGRRR